MIHYTIGGIMRLFGYCRVSTKNQAKVENGHYVGSLKTQRDLLIANGVDEKRIVVDIASGATFDRLGVNELLLKMEEGDKLLVSKLDRLGRNTLEMLELVTQFDEKGITVRFIQDGISTEGDTGKMVLTILSAVATAERARIMERTNEGRKDAMARGIKFGRKKVVDEKQVYELKKQGLNHSEIARQLSISRSTVIRCLKLSSFYDQVN